MGAEFYTGGWEATLQGGIVNLGRRDHCRGTKGSIGGGKWGHLLFGFKKA